MMKAALVAAELAGLALVGVFAAPGAMMILLAASAAVWRLPVTSEAVLTARLLAATLVVALVVALMVVPTAAV